MEMYYFNLIGTLNTQGSQVKELFIILGIRDVYVGNLAWICILSTMKR